MILNLNNYNKTEPCFYKNQELAGNTLYERIVTEGFLWTLLTAACQTGKTGAAIYLAEKLYDEGYRFLIFGPSDTVLRDQLQKRSEKYPKLSSRLIGSRIWHAGDIYSGGAAYSEMFRHMRDAIMLDDKVLVIFDEAHIGIGAKNKDELQKIPQFLRDVCESLPGATSTNKNIRTLLITATPFTYDAFMKDSGDFGEVYLRPGEGYVGLSNLLDHGRVLPHIARHIPKHIKGKERAARKETLNNDYVKQMANLMTSHTSNGYFVVRSTVHKDHGLFRKAAAMASVKLKVFDSKSRNISDFEKTLLETPEEPTVLMIKQSYKQGKTLCLDNISAWYENDTWSGRHDADMVQSLGRCLGYHKDKDYTFPVYCDVPMVEALAEYYDHCERGDFTSKREKPHSSTHTKHRVMKRPVRKYYVGRSPEEIKQIYKNLNPGHENPYFVESKVSRQNARNVVSEVLAGTRRQSTDDRVNIYHFDAPSKHPDSCESFMNNPHLHGRWLVLVDTEEEEMQITTFDSSYFSHVKLQVVDD